MFLFGKVSPVPVQPVSPQNATSKERDRVSVEWTLQGAFCQAEQGGLWDFASVWAAAGVRGRAGLPLSVEGLACR